MGEQVRTLCVKFSNTLNGRLQQMILVSWALLFRSSLVIMAQYMGF